MKNVAVIGIYCVGGLADFLCILAKDGVWHRISWHEHRDVTIEVIF